MFRTRRKAERYLKDWGLRKGLGMLSSNDSLLMLMCSQHLMKKSPTGAEPAETRLILMRKGAVGG